nr:hypothetical protein [Tanacetum cinerariifolium]
DLLSLQKPKKKSHADQYIFQRRISEPAGSSFHDESPYAVLGQSDSDEESEKVVLGATEGSNDKDQAGPDPGTQAEGQTGTDAGTLDEGQAGSNPDEMSEGHAGPDPGNAGDEEQSIPSPVVYAGSDREHMDLDVADATETSDKPPKAKKSKFDWVSKKRTLKNVEETKAKEVLAMEPQVVAEDTDLQKALEESMETAYALPRGPLPPVVIREPELGKCQPLPEVPGKGKAKVTEEQRRHKFHPRPFSPLHLPNEETVLGYLKFSANGTKREVFGILVASSSQKFNRLHTTRNIWQKWPSTEEETKAKEVLAMEPQVVAEDTDLQKALEESMETAYALPRGPLPPVVIREPELGKCQPLPEVPG